MSGFVPGPVRELSPDEREVPANDARERVALGLVQIPTDGLERLAAWIDEGRPLLLTGDLVGLKGEP